VSEVRSSGVRRPERLLVGADTRKIVRETKAEGGSTWRVYVKDWLLDFRSDSPEMAWNAQQVKFKGRLHPDDMRVEEREGSFVSEVRRWTTSGEFKVKEVALGYLDALIEDGADPTTLVLVERNTKAEQALKDYGRVLLPAGV
jgi:hypothetical protein